MTKNDRERNISEKRGTYIFRTKELQTQLREMESEREYED